MEYTASEFIKDKYEEWNRFCLESDDAWFWHTADWLDYTLHYKPELKTQNVSFFVYKQDKIKAVVPLTLETHKFGNRDVCEFSFGGGAIPAPVLNDNLSKAKHDRKERDLVYEFIFNEIDRLARRNNVVRALFRQTPLSPKFLSKDINFNHLMKFGYIDSSLNTQLIDLSKTEEELWNDLRRNHRRNIEKGKRFQITIYTSENITKDVFSAYKDTHHRAAGRKTRPDATFNLMYDWITDDLSFLAVAELDKKKVGFEYYSIYKSSAYGFSAANEPEYEHLPIRHALEWEAILWMKKRGLSFYEIGLQQYGILPHDFPDTKQLNISHFKKGFGGFTVPLFMGEKYYDKEYFLKTYQERIYKFGELMGSEKYGQE